MITATANTNTKRPAMGRAVVVHGIHAEIERDCGKQAPAGGLS